VVIFGVPGLLSIYKTLAGGWMFRGSRRLMIDY
jgi:hypothetical protein